VLSLYGLPRLGRRDVLIQAERAIARIEKHATVARVRHHGVEVSVAVNIAQFNVTAGRYAPRTSGPRRNRLVSAGARTHASNRAEYMAHSHAKNRTRLMSCPPSCVCQLLTAFSASEHRHFHAQVYGVFVEASRPFGGASDAQPRQHEFEGDPVTASQ